MPRAELKDILEVDDAIATSHSKSIHIAYAKYNACNAAVRFYDTIVAEDGQNSTRGLQLQRLDNCLSLKLFGILICPLFPGHHKV